jgi:hypothetical protein
MLHLQTITCLLANAKVFQPKEKVFPAADYPTEF